MSWYGVDKLSKWRVKFNYNYSFVLTFPETGFYNIIIIIIIILIIIIII